MGITAEPREPRPTGRASERPGAPVTDHDRRSIELSRTALEALFGPVAERSFAVRYWTGEVDSPDDATPRFTLVLASPGSLRRMLLPPTELRICEAYLRSDFDIEGDIEGAAALGDGLLERIATPQRIARVVRAVRELPSDVKVAAPSRRVDESVRKAPRHAPRRDAHAVRSHYDVGNDFYRLWLDERMVYSCGYFSTPDATLDDAQLAKIDHICRKLRLQPGEQLLDVGCGWGALIMHAVRRYGVTALGVTLSYDQAELARERIREAGLEDRCTVEVRDYRHLPLDATFDKISSVGMIEHVGCEHLSEYFTHLYGLLRPGGLFLNHGIVHAERGMHTQSLVRRFAGKLWREGAFIDQYVFPDGELPALSQVLSAAESTGFETRDVEALREHYARTLRHWVHRLERVHSEAAALVGEETYRTWRLYMAASAYGFASARLNIVQTLLGKPDAGGNVMVPMTRDDLYLQ